ncbi:hypothetical protein M595_0725 [Lyngbya aestuarii BL J]|uniref:Uncharacterized protein n=1 Tax=Lyngbya aestuarii BL J TaxID=1348334 RepID=U7QPS8_9CYAN|nr:hypothetical protein M595_0725 [Lyngbya aestuarii BL J]
MLFSPNYSRIINPDVTLQTLKFSLNIQLKITDLYQQRLLDLGKIEKI